MRRLLRELRVTTPSSKVTYLYQFRGGIVAGGLLSGVIAGGLMALTATLRTDQFGTSPWAPLGLIGGTFGRLLPIPLSASGLLGFGVLGHLLLSALFGLFFAVFARHTTPVRVALIGGLIYGAALWFLMAYVVLPVVNPSLRSQLSLLGAHWFLCHLVYGTALTVTPSLCRLFSRTTRYVAAPEASDKRPAA